MSDMGSPQSEQPTGQDDKNLMEELEVAGNQLVREVERLIQEGNVRRLIIKRGDEVLFQVKLTLGVAGIGAAALLAPWFAVILSAAAFLAAAAARVTIVIERDNPVQEVGEKLQNVGDKLTEE